MANIKKSFNFRNGVQVDEDNLLVTPTGLVAIGKTIPTEALDVIGNVVISGVTSSVFSQTGILTVTTLEPTEIIGAGVSVVSGVVTSNSGSGIVTYYGDARFLQGMPTSQWEDTDVGFGVSSIYNTGGTVGIATTNPQFTLQVGANPNDELPGVGIASAGNINAHGNITSKSINVGNNIQLGNAGIITAASFIGSNLTGNVTGNLTGNVSSDTVVSGIATFSKDLDVDGHTNLDNVSISGVTTFTGATTHSGGATVNTHLDVIGLTTLDDVNVSSGATFAGTIDANGNLDVAGVSTFNDNIDANKDLDVDGHTNLDNVSISGVTTSSGNINLPDNVNLQFGDSQDLKIYHGLVGGHSYIENTTGSLRLKNGGSTALEITNDGTTAVNNLTVTQGVNVTGIITATTELNSPLIGVGTDLPAHDIQVRKSGAAEIQVTSDTNSAGITVGREPSSGKTNNAEFRYGFSAGSDYNTAQSLDIINYGTDNFNYFLSANNPGAVTGNYFWHKGLNNVRLMTLTNTGRLGIGITAPTDELHVIGGATVSGNIVVGNNVTVSGNIIGNVQGTLTGNVAGTLAGNTNTTVGISTLNNLSIAGIATAARLRANKFAIGENPNLDLISIFISNTNKVFVNDVGQVGISTTIALPGVGVNGSSTNAVFNSIGIGITQFTSAAVDLRDAGTATSRYMMPPKVNTSQRASLVGVESGAVIYNTSLNKLQVYVGSGAYNVANWQNLH